MSHSTEREASDTLPHVVRTVIDIAAPPAEVFEALTDPRELAAWWGGDERRTLDCDSDARPGGAWRVRTIGPDGEEHAVGGEYRVVDPPDHLEQTWQADDDAAPSVVRYDLEPSEVDGGEGTRLTVTHTSHTALAAGASVALPALRRRFEPHWCSTRPHPAWALRVRPTVARA
jgi:uncharacterized protein YndB with AHSA1/START domain